MCKQNREKWEVRASATEEKSRDSWPVPGVQMVGTAQRDLSWTNSEASAFCLTGQEERVPVRGLQSSSKILETPMHVPFPLQCWDVIAKFRGYNNIAKRREETKVKKIFQSVSRFLSEIVALTVKKVTCFWWTRTRKIDIPFILWWPNNVWCYDNRNVTCIHFVHFTIFREFTKKLDQVPNEGENKKKTVRILFKNQASRK